MEMNGNSREAVFQEIISLADAMADRLTARRRDFHKYAETGWFEMRTSSLIARRLTELGYEVLTGDQVCKKDSRMGVPSDAELEKQYERAVSQGADPEFVERTRGGMTGVIGILHCGEGPIVGMRFDIDALGVFESESREHRPARETCHHWSWCSGGSDADQRPASWYCKVDFPACRRRGAWRKSYRRCWSFR